MPPEPAIPFVEIRARAYELWDRNHRPEGCEISFWLMAERELRAERAGRAAAAGEEPIRHAAGGADPAEPN